MQIKKLFLMVLKKHRKKIYLYNEIKKLKTLNFKYNLFSYKIYLMFRTYMFMALLK